MATHTWAATTSTSASSIGSSPSSSRTNGLDLSSKGNEMALQRLKDAAEKAKIELSTTVETEINLPFITADATGPKHLVRKLTRAKLEQLVEELIERSVEPCKRALADAGVSTSQIDEVVLVGGQTRMPKIQELVKNALRQGAASRRQSR